MTVAEFIKPTTFVLVHGAWHGGWCWKRVADILRQRGHVVTKPTQTGLGERSHLLSESITLPVFVDDIVNHLKWEDLRDVVLVGHSFGGAAITGAADGVPERIAGLIYLDAAIMEDGETWFSLLPKELVKERIQAAKESSSGLSLPVAPVETFGIFDPADAEYLVSKLTPHPLATFTSELKLDGPVGNGLPASYVACTDPVYEPTLVCRQRVKEAGWPIVELATGHDAMITAPLATADLLERLSIDMRGT
jgi:pimeloyl-ACP methyl ester carboxylesterase